MCMGYLPRETPEAAVLVGDAEDGLLAAVALCSAHVLRPIFPPLTARRPGPHDFLCRIKMIKTLFLVFYIDLFFINGLLLTKLCLKPISLRSSFYSLLCLFQTLLFH